MHKYHFIIVADNILLERGLDIPIVGFVAPRCFRAKTEQEASQRVKIELLKSWKIDFNRDNKVGTPQLTIYQIRKMWNPFKRLKLAEEFIFFGTEEEKSAAIDQASAAYKRWFLIR